jgi:hypothetical protein
MGQRLLLAAGALMLVAAVAIGTFGASWSGWNTAASIGMPGGAAGPAGMMRGYGPGMMGGAYSQAPVSGQTISIDQAQQAVERFVAGSGAGLRVDELIEFQDNFYAIAKEKSTGIGAFEVLVNKVTGAVSREPGPGMMWNTEYGMMGGFIRQTGPMTVSKDRAAEIAQGWLDTNQPGTKTEEPDAFHGYYTVHFTKDGNVAGMLSVNGYTGQVWYHSWHGAFVQEREIAP